MLPGPVPGRAGGPAAGLPPCCLSFFLPDTEGCDAFAEISVLKKS